MAPSRPGCAAVSAGLARRAFLTSLTANFDLPLIGELQLSTVLIFDIGVYMLVVGATTLILVALAHQSMRSRRRPVAADLARDKQTPRLILNEPGAGV